MCSGFSSSVWLESTLCKSLPYGLKNTFIVTSFPIFPINDKKLEGKPGFEATIMVKNTPRCHKGPDSLSLFTESVLGPATPSPVHVN